MRGIASPPAQVAVKGRSVPVPAAAMGAARFAFADLCEAPLGARDFLAIARQYHTLMVENVPVIGDGKRNEAKRFITLIDTLYDNRNKLVVSAAAHPHELYRAKSGTEAFEFDRTASRLVEMRSDDWIAAKKPMALSAKAMLKPVSSSESSSFSAFSAWSTLLSRTMTCTRSLPLHGLLSGPSQRTEN